jgi:integrase/recombinase XerC
MAWLRALRARNYSKATLGSYRQTGSQFIVWCHDHDLRLATVTHTDVQAWLDSRTLGPRAAYHYVSRLASFYRWCVLEEHLVRDPTLRVERPRLGRYLPRPADEPTVLTAMLQSEPRVALMIACGFYAGMRRGEIARLRAEDLLLNQDPPMVLVHGKGNKERLVPAHDALLLAVRLYGLPKSGFLFVGLDSGRPLNPGRVGALITEALDKVGDHTTPHQLRHLAATRWYAICHDIRLVQELLGHASPATTAVYTAFSNEDAIRVVTGRDEAEAV